MKSFSVLKKQIYSEGIYSIVPIRYEDRFAIMKWRNEQIFHLRQNKPLTIEAQERYFKNIVEPLFSEEKPSHILFSFLEGDICIGYGGLVHINWIYKNAEISFIMATELENNSFQKYWMTYLKLIEQLAFEELNLHKIYTYAFDLRPHLYFVLEQSGYRYEARLTEHCFFEGKYFDVVIHSKRK